MALQESDWYFWFDRVTTYSSLALALLGFGFTLYQLKKTKSAAEAASRASSETLSQVQRLSLVSLLPQLLRIDDEIDRAVELESTELLRFWLSQWKWQASEARGLLNPDVDGEKKLMRSIQSSVAAAAQTKRELHGISPGQYVVVTADVRTLVGRVTGELGMITSQQMRSTGAGG